MEFKSCLEQRHIRSAAYELCNLNTFWANVIHEKVIHETYLQFREVVSCKKHTRPTISLLNFTRTSDSARSQNCRENYIDRRISSHASRYASWEITASFIQGWCEMYNIRFACISLNYFVTVHVIVYCPSCFQNSIINYSHTCSGLMVGEMGGAQKEEAFKSQDSPYLKTGVIVLFFVLNFYSACHINGSI